VELALECLDNLVFSDECRKEMTRNNALVLLPKAARICATGEDGDLVRKRVQRIMWVLTRQGESPEMRQLQHQYSRPAVGRHIFLSFCGMEMPEKAKLIRNGLEQAGYRICCHKSRSEPEEVAEAVSVSSFFVLFVTRGYKESPECRLEALIAEEARKAIVLITLEPDIDRGFGWLFQLAGGKILIDFANGPVDGSHPSILRIINIAMQWIGTPPPRLTTSVSSNDITSSPSIRPQQVPVKVGAAVSSPQIRAQAQVPSALHVSPTHVQPPSLPTEGGAWA
jgi:hypothetical protein